MVTDETDHLRSALLFQVSRETKELFGDVPETWVNYAAEAFWDETSQLFRLDDLRAYGVQAGGARVLDLAAGCGQFVFCAVAAGFDCFGIEPEKWKLEFAKNKNEALGRPKELAQRICEGVGENMPFVSNSFDCVTTYQTLEHVQDPRGVLGEMVRVTKPGGVLLIRCPDYLSTFEAHYQVPWFPLMPRKLAHAYLRAIGRPAKGLDSIRYVTKGRIVNWLTEIERDSKCNLQIVDCNFVSFANHLRRMHLSALSLGYPAYQLMRHLRGLFRKEISVSVAVRICSKGA